MQSFWCPARNWLLTENQIELSEKSGSLPESWEQPIVTFHCTVQIFVFINCLSFCGIVQWFRGHFNSLNATVQQQILPSYFNFKKIEHDCQL